MYFLFMDKFTEDECLKQINAGIYLNNTRGEIGREERNKECDYLLLRYFDRCRFTELKNDVKFFVFSDATTTMTQAIESYRIGMFDACMVMVRNTIDATMFAALNYEVAFNKEKTAPSSLNLIGGILGFEDYKDWEKRIDALKQKKFIDDEDADKLGKIHIAGHFSAHYFLKRRENMHKFIENRAKLAENNKNEYPKTFTNEKECKKHLNDAFDILEKLINAYISTEIKKLNFIT